MFHRNKAQLSEKKVHKFLDENSKNLFYLQQANLGNKVSTLTFLIISIIFC